MAKRCKTLTKAQVAKLEKLKAIKDVTINLIYSFGENGNIPFNSCYNKATECARETYNKARRAVWDFEQSMVDQGRGYWRDSGSFQAYSKY